MLFDSCLYSMQQARMNLAVLLGINFVFRPASVT